MKRVCAFQTQPVDKYEPILSERNLPFLSATIGWVCTNQKWSNNNGNQIQGIQE